MDEPEFEITEMGREDGSGPPPGWRFRGPQSANRWRLALVAVSVLVVLAVLMNVWLPLHTNQSTELGSPSPTATAIRPPTPVPVVGRLGPPPQHCPAALPLAMITVPPFGGFTGPVQLSGQAPVWVEDYLPEGFADLGPVSSTPSWPGIDLWWEIGPTQHPTVTVRAFSLDTGETAWWGEGNVSPTLPVLVMSPAVDFPGATAWTTYMTTLYITHAGCYELQVSWADGSWYTNFAAGQTSTASSP